jgi:ABC-2 type transport system permease protein
MLRLMRNKTNIFWILLFPIMLGCMFKVAFSNLGSSENFHAIPVAVVCDESAEAENFRLAADELTTGDEPMLTITYCDKDEAMQLLEDQEVIGILDVGSSLALTISENMSNEQTNQSILSMFVQQYNLNSQIVAETAMQHPEKLPELVASITENTGYHEEVSLSRSKGDTYTQYFYNLIAMACLYTAISGILIAVENQANMSTLAARKNIAPASKLACMIGELIANVVFEFVLNMLAFLFIVLVLRVDMTTRLPFALLTIFVSTLTSISLGLFLGIIGPKTEGGKIGMMFAIVMPCCFLSGLMAGNMRIIVEQHAPIINRINPAALISDCFYSLATYESMARYTRDIVTLLVFSVVFCLAGFLVIRRRKYASL